MNARPLPPLPPELRPCPAQRMRCLGLGNPNCGEDLFVMGLLDMTRRDRRREVNNRFFRDRLLSDEQHLVLAQLVAPSR